jgi:hypothetical protein
VAAQDVPPELRWPCGLKNSRQNFFEARKGVLADFLVRRLTL